MTHHLAILKKQYLDDILLGRKTAECRLSATRRPPFGAVSPGDLLWLKRSGGPVLATARVRRVYSFHPVVRETITHIRSCFGEAIRANLAFFKAHVNARYGTVITFDRINAIAAFQVFKRDRAAWVVLPGTLLKPDGSRRI